MGLGNSENDVIVDDGGGGGGGLNGKSFGGSVSCSICLEVVADNGDRSWAKLQCGHQFHLDCIGSAFNVKGAMQCPNCRKIEKGQWLYANGCRSLPEFSMEDWAHDEDLYDLSYSEMSFGVHWCPFGSLTRLPSSFEEGEFSSNGYHDLLGQHAIFAEHTAAVSSATHPCPYIAYVGPIHPSSSNSSGSVSDVSSFHIYFLVLYNCVICASFVHSSSARPGSSATSSMIPPYQGSNARARDRVQALQAYYQQLQPGNSPPIRTPVVSGSRRSSSHRGMPQLGAVASSSDQTGFYFIPSGATNRNFQEAENPPPARFHSWERNHLAGKWIYNMMDGNMPCLRSLMHYIKTTHGF